MAEYIGKYRQRERERERERKRERGVGRHIYIMYNVFYIYV